jgi:hypothetical protein
MVTNPVFTQFRQLESAGTETRANELPNASPENYFRFQTTGQWGRVLPGSGSGQRHERRQKA